MNKNIMKAVLAIAIVFLFAAMPFSGAVRAAEQAGGVVRNVAPSTDPADKTGIYALNADEAEADNSGSDTETINCTAYDRNGDTDAEINQGACWLNITNATGVGVQNWTSFTWNSGTGAVFKPGTANDGLFFISDNAVDEIPNIVYTVPSTYGIGTWTVNIHIQDDDGLWDDQTDTFNVVAAIEVLGIYNYTGLAVDIVSTFYWNFTAAPGASDPGVAPGTLNVTSGNYTTYTYANSPSTNYDYVNATARTYSYWLVVKNAGTNAAQTFTLTFTNDQFDSASTTDTIPIDGVIDFEWYQGTAAPGGAGADDPNEHGPTTNITNDANGIQQFTFTATNSWIWIRFMVDIPEITADATDYVCPFTVAAP